MGRASGEDAGDVAALTGSLRDGDRNLVAGLAARFELTPEDIVAGLVARGDNGRRSVIEGGHFTELNLFSLLTSLWLTHHKVDTISEVDFGDALRLDALPALRALEMWCHPVDEVAPVGSPALEWLGCRCRVKLDLGRNPELKNLNLHGSPLRALELSANPRLESLCCNHVPLDHLDLTPVPRLRILQCGYEELGRLDVSPCPDLTTLQAVRCGLEDLELRGNPGLTGLSCFDNRLTRLELTGLPQGTTASPVSRPSSGTRPVIWRRPSASTGSGGRPTTPTTRRSPRSPPATARATASSASSRLLSSGASTSLPSSRSIRATWGAAITWPSSQKMPGPRSRRSSG